MAEEKKSFCCPENYQVLIPYRDLVRIAEMAQKVEVIEAQYKRLEDQYAAIRGMFSECLDRIREIQNWVKD